MIIHDIFYMRILTGVDAKYYATIDCIFLLNAFVSKVIHVHSGEQLHCCFIDYEKAFDRIDTPLLWRTLIFEKVSSKLVKALNQCMLWSEHA